jgi:uncharacterized membrane protein YgcG
LSDISLVQVLLVKLGKTRDHYESATAFTHPLNHHQWVKRFFADAVKANKDQVDKIAAFSNTAKGSRKQQQQVDADRQRQKSESGGGGGGGGGSGGFGGGGGGFHTERHFRKQIPLN